jgi:phage gp36-like protein
MNYATVQDMVDRFGELELIQLTAGAAGDAVDADKAGRALGDAQAFVDGFVGAVYQLPLQGCAKPAPTVDDPAAVVLVPPPALTRATCDVARYYLYDQVAPEHEVFVRFKAAQQSLQALADGKTVLTCPWGGQPGLQLAGSEPGSGEVAYSFAPRIDAELEGYR